MACLLCHVLANTSHVPTIPDNIPKLEKRTESFSRRRERCYQMADVLAVRDDYRAQTWRMLIQECSNSGLTKREFCRQRGISEKSFYYWLRKLRSQMAEAAGPQIVQLESSVTSTEILQIRYRGAELKLPVGVDIEAVAALLRSIQSL